METKNSLCRISQDVKSEAGKFFGKLYSFNESLKLYHWHVTGEGSYARHIALDQALGALRDSLDALVETSYALYGELDIVIPETKLPEDLIGSIDGMYCCIKEVQDNFPETFTQSILDDYMQSLQQLAYRLKRLS